MKRTGLGTAAMVIAIVAATYFATRHEAGARRQSAEARPGHFQALPALESRAVLPTGMTITPMAAQGSLYVPLNPGLEDFPDYVAGQPVTTAMSPDGATLLVLTSGYNEMSDASGRRIKRDSNEYVFVFDISQGRATKKRKCCKWRIRSMGLRGIRTGRNFTWRAAWMTMCTCLRNKMGSGRKQDRRLRWDISTDWELM